MSWEDKKNKVYVGDLNYNPEVTQNEHLADNIEVIEITLREEVVYDVALTPAQKAVLAKALDDMNIPVLQLHAQGTADVIKACRDAGVRALMEVICRPYHSYGYGDWSAEVRAAVAGGADIIKPSITTPRKWMMGEAGATVEDIAQKAVDSVKLAKDSGVKRVTLGFTDAPRTDMNFLIDVAGRTHEAGADTILLNDTVGVAKPSLINYMVRTIKAATGAKLRVHCHNDFGLATANTLAAVEAGADGVETVVNGADPARSGIAPLAEVVLGILCLYRRDLGIKTESMTEVARLFADYTGMPIAEQKPIVAERNWMYKRDHIMRTITKDESIQFPFSPSLVGEHLRVGMGRGSGPVGITAKLKELGINVGENAIPLIVDRVNAEAVQRKRRLTDDEFRDLVQAVA